MRCYLFLIFSFLLNPVAQADRIKDFVFDIDLASNPEEPHLIKLSQGRVVFLKQNKNFNLDTFKRSLDFEEVLEIEVNQNNEPISVSTINSPGSLNQSFLNDDLNQSDAGNMSYAPTELDNYDQAVSKFIKMRRDWQNQSQCYNRAHIWAYEEHRRSDFNSLKLFLFFTSRYIRNYNFYWWFHVSPMTLVKDGDSLTKLVLDRRYTRGPLYLKTWTNIFIRSKRTCPLIQTYSYYRNNQQSQDCYLIPVSQYFWQPRDIVRYEQTGIYKNSFIPSEVSWAYKEAF
jgi:hypothetical protein